MLLVLACNTYPRVLEGPTGDNCHTYPRVLEGPTGDNCQTYPRVLEGPTGDNCHQELQQVTKIMIKRQHKAPTRSLIKKDGGRRLPSKMTRAATNY